MQNDNRNHWSNFPILDMIIDWAMKFLEQLLFMSMYVDFPFRMS